jgi:hypothetical protein
MLTGLALLLAGIALLALSMVLPRLHRQIMHSFTAEMQALMTAFSPEMGRLLALPRLLLPAGRICAGISGALLLLAAYAFLTPRVPLWLQGIAWAAFLGVVALGVLLGVAARRFLPVVQGFLGKGR